MGGAAGGGPDRAEIDQLAFQTLDLDPQRRTPGERQCYHACGAIGLLERYGQEVEHYLLVAAIDVAALEGIDAVEPQRAAAALIVRPPRLGALPVETGKPDHEPLFAGPPVNITDAHHRVLQMGRNDLEIIHVECDELEELHPIFSPRKLCC